MAKHRPSMVTNNTLKHMLVVWNIIDKIGLVYITINFNASMQLWCAGSKVIELKPINGDELMEVWLSFVVNTAVLSIVDIFHELRAQNNFSIMM